MSWFSPVSLKSALSTVPMDRQKLLTGQFADKPTCGQSRDSSQNSKCWH